MSYSFRTKMKKIVKTETCLDSGLACNDCPFKTVPCRDIDIVEYAIKWLRNHREE